MSADAYAAALQSVTDNLRRGSGTPGVAAGISVAGQRACAYSGLADASRGWNLVESSRFGIACITKLLIALVANRIVAAGQVDYQDRVANYLPNIFEGRRADITVAHLLTHTAGFQGPMIANGGHRGFTWEKFEAEFHAWPQIFDPGAVFNYENLGHVIVGKILEIVTGESVPSLLKRYVFDPLEISPGEAAKNYRDERTFVSPHRIDGGAISSIFPVPFGKMWEGSLADISLTVSDFLTIGEAIVGLDKRVDFSDARLAMGSRVLMIPQQASGIHREHVATYFNLVCAEYKSGWYGYAGSALGQTCGLRVNLENGTACVVAMNAWLPIARDALLDKICGTQTHPEAGLQVGNNNIDFAAVSGSYVGGGNVIRSVAVVEMPAGELEFRFGEDGVEIPTFRLKMAENRNLVPDPKSTNPPVGFFREPGSRRPCLLVGMQALRQVQV
jgi:Beta-lactamase